MGIIKSGKVVVILQGRYAGKKAVVVKSYEEGTTERKFSHATGPFKTVADHRHQLTLLHRSGWY